MAGGRKLKGIEVSSADNRNNRSSSKGAKNPDAIEHEGISAISPAKILSQSFRMKNQINDTENNMES